MSRDWYVALPCSAMCLSAVYDCGISLSYPLTIFLCLPKYPFRGFWSKKGLSSTIKAIFGISKNGLNLKKVLSMNDKYSYIPLPM